MNLLEIQQLSKYDIAILETIFEYIIPDTVINSEIKGKLKRAMSRKLTQEITAKEWVNYNCQCDLEGSLTTILRHINDYKESLSNNQFIKPENVPNITVQQLKCIFKNME